MQGGGEYENYSETSKDYDTGRQPVGLEVFVGSISLLMTGKTDTASVVDIGCGTGNYASALSPYVGQITGVEYNPGMLKQAKAKTANLKNVTLVQGDATNIPLPNGYCDVVYSTQVIHHLLIEDGIYTGFSKFIKESYRILKDHGILILNTDSPDQAERCWMGAGLAPIAGKAVAMRCPPIATVVSEIEATGYKIQSINLHCYPNLHKPAIFTDRDGPLSASWRALDSVWSACSQEEIMAAHTLWKDGQEKGTINKLFEGMRQSIQQIGETTTIVAHKGPSW